VFLSGLGGLGSIAAYYLVAAGIGHMRIVDRDLVEVGNLNRQILHWTDDVGHAKSNSAMEKLNRLNPACRIEAFHEEIREDTIWDLIGNSSIIVDGTDNLNTRKILNVASLKKDIPYIFGGVDGLNGMVATFVPGETACLECLFPGEISNRKAVGVLGPIPGMVASIQALEAIKLILEMDGLLKNKVLHIRGSDMSFKTISVERNPECEVCNQARGESTDE
jgi:adenylyltransferase/sulfurtransferase